LNDTLNTKMMQNTPCVSTNWSPNV